MQLGGTAWTYEGTAAAAAVVADAVDVDTMTDQSVGPPSLQEPSLSSSAFAEVPFSLDLDFEEIAIVVTIVHFDHLSSVAPT